jgi:hypothetical protein
MIEQDNMFFKHMLMSMDHEKLVDMYIDLDKSQKVLEYIKSEDKQALVTTQGEK